MKTYEDIYGMMRCAITTYDCMQLPPKYCYCGDCGKESYCGVDTIILSMTMLYNL
jgi:hypothetical protein